MVGPSTGQLQMTGARMPVSDLPGGWGATRSALQKYAQALTAFPRAGAPQQSRWAHVSMDPVPGGFAATETPLSDGTALRSIIDIRGHKIIVAAGNQSLVLDMADGRSPHAVGEAIMRVSDRHGEGVPVDQNRFADGSPQTYEPLVAEAFLESAAAAIGALEALIEERGGEVVGPHLWPHGFDIAMEWFSRRLVPFEDSMTNAQIATGWYPGEESYIYVNPWPFDASFTDIDLPGGGVWNLEGWQGAKLSVPPGGALSTDLVIEFAGVVHDATRSSLEG